MPDDTERLVVALEARIRDFEKNMQKAERTGTRSYKQLTAGSSRATRQMEADAIRSTTRINQAFATISMKVGAVGKAFGATAFATLSGAAIAVLAPILSVAAALDKTKQAMDEFGAISDSAKAAGLDSEFFQVLAHQSELGGVAVDQLSGALETFSKNAGLAAEGKGKMVKALQVLNPELLKNILAATTQEERVKLAADAIDRAGTASEKAALSATLFGDSGTRLVGVFTGGAKAIDETARAARDMGIIIDREVISRAEEMGDELETATKIMNLQFSQALIDLAPLLIDAASLAGQVASAIARIVDSMRDLENQSTTGLNTKLATIDAQRLDLETQILQKQQEQREEIGKLSDIANNLGFEDSKNTQLSGVTGQIKALEDERRKLTEEGTKIVNILNGRKPIEFTKPKATEDDDEDDPARPKRGGTSSRNAEAEAALREAEAVKELISDLEFERSLISMTDEQRRAAIVTRQAGTAATKDQRDQIVALNEALHDEEEAHKRAADAADFFKQAAYDSFSSLVPQIETGNKALDSFINKMIEAVAQAALLGDGPLAGIFGGGKGLLGSLFGGLAKVPAYANGTNSAPGGVALVGERGPEMVVLPHASRVIPNDKLGQSVSSVSMTVAGSTIIVQGDANEKTLNAMRAMLDHRDREMSRNFGKMTDARLKTQQTRGTRA